jgi:hypothetical protein
MMGDLADDYRAMNEAKNIRRELRTHKNIGRLQESLFKGEISYRIVNSGSTYLFREDGKPKVDFYPGTGRWKVKNKMYKGGAEKFLHWYRNKT